MSELLLDTHIWLWYLAGAKRLPAKLKRRIDRQSEACWLSPVSVWEAGMLARRGRIRLADDYASWLQRARDGFPVHEAAVTFDVAFRAQHLELPGCDPADHFIAATALELDLTLVTIDERLNDASWLPTLSG